MCGVVGLLLKDPSLESELGALLAPMIEALSDRGPDSSGIALYSRTGRDDAGKISLGSDEPMAWPAICTEVADRFGATARPLPGGALVEVVPEGRTDEVVAYVAEHWPLIRTVATGRRVVVIKDTGRPEETARAMGLTEWEGYLAVAHTRMATESAVTLLHSHPFVPAPDLCVVHNGSFSNYASVRRSLQSRGVRFDSDNDSEVAARLLAERLGSGDDLAEATRWIMKELDGFFTLVITSADGMSVVRDAFACKPAVVAETDRYVAVASEYRALAHLPDIGNADVFEPQPEEVYTWTH
jgi:glutamate synthase domain-containing protein 1